MIVAISVNEDSTKRFCDTSVSKMKNINNIAIY
jgi:hypothetical protein